jgi:hypothetical protein
VCMVIFGARRFTTALFATVTSFGSGAIFKSVGGRLDSGDC